MKRARRDWPKGIVEVGASKARKRDPRSDEADPQATQKISREQLDAVLKGTRSGFRPAVRSEPTFQEPADLADVMRESLLELEPSPLESQAHGAHDAIVGDLASEPVPDEASARAVAIVTPGVMAPVTSFEPLPEVVARATAQQLTPSRLRTRLPVPARIVLFAISVLVLSIAIGSLIAFVTGPR